MVIAGSVLEVVGRGSLKGRDIEIEAGPVPRLKQWSFVRIPSINWIGFHQQRCVEIQDGTTAEAHGEAVGTPHGDPGFHHSAQHHAKTGGFRNGHHDDPFRQAALGNFNINVICRTVLNNGLEVAQ